MKLLARDEKSFTFELDRTEREMLTFVLRRYPALDLSYHQVAAPADRESFGDEQRMLTECMTTEQADNRRQVAEFIRTRLATSAATNPPATSPPAAANSPSAASVPPAAQALTSVRITRPEADWLLRVINDVRVGSWVRLGCPEVDRLEGPVRTGANVLDYVAMELGDFFQLNLLDALGA